ncbi:hypothetical protein JJB63_15400 [Clostridium perfringens]|uniref:hypothetical protein n=1 Tax=Clostridium perfringens TaxID=1502 RepID=UPI001A2265A7|nr:hypothetical protein [Clostridium perfringens]MBO3326951.1 hypothetical protein [Clostridium perfringens]HAT4356311.1 hypothetical protein [Clostridium perfringens]
MIWSELSSNINYYINNKICGEEILKENIVLLNQYINDTFILKDCVYKYLDKKTYEYIDLTEEYMEKIEYAFIERLEKKRKINKENHTIMINDYIKNEKNKGKNKVIELKNYRK